MSAVKEEDANDKRRENGDTEAAVRARLARKRTKSGCLTCRKRRIKCDEGKPICRNCQKSRRQCEGYNQRVAFRPADFQYLGPHGAATITFHTSMLPGAIGPPSDGQPELRPRAVAPQGLGLHHAAQQYQLQQGYQGLPLHMYTPPLLMANQLQPPGQQFTQLPQWNTYGSMQPQVFDVNDAQAQVLPHAQIPVPPMQGLPQQPAPYQYPGPIPVRLPRDGLQEQQHAATHVWPTQKQPTPPVWPVPQAQPEQHIPETKPQWQTVPARVTISQTQTQTTTTVQHEWPTVDYAPRPELVRPIDQSWAERLDQAQPSVVQNQVAEHYNDIDSPPPLPFAANHQASYEAAPSHQSFSPAQILDEAAIEQHDDNYHDIDEEDDLDLEISVANLEHNKSQGVLKSIVTMSGLHASVLNLRGFDTYIYDGILDTYRPEWAANPLRNASTARVFAHFITATGPLLTIFVRQTRVPSAFHHDGDLPLNQQGLWTHIMPMAALHHAGLLQAMLAISSLHIAKLQRASETPSFKHYGYALKRIHRSVRDPKARHSPSMLAATLLLGYYEIMGARHSAWNTHLIGARQLITEIDFASMTKRLRCMKREKAERDRQNMCYLSSMLPLPYSNQPQDIILDQIPDVDEGVVSLFSGKTLSYDQYGQVIDDRDDPPVDDASPLNLVDYETLKDLFWWYCKQDVYQSIISGNPLLMSFDHWTDCPPRAPLNAPEAVFGSFDHLMLLLARVADFTVRDRKRKLRVMQANGGQWRPAPGLQMGPPPGQGQPQGQGSPQDRRGSVSMPGPPPQSMPQPGSTGGPPPMQFFGMAPDNGHRGSMPSSYNPTHSQPTQQTPTPGSSPPEYSKDLPAMTELALQDWQNIKDTAEFFASQLGPYFQPLGPEYQPPMPSPFGPVIFYRSWDISCLWAIYNMCMLVLMRAHPHMPPAAHMAAGVAAYQTREYVLRIGQISAGIPMPPPDEPLNPNLAASLCDLAVPLFFSGISYQAADQRAWVVKLLYDIDSRAGWATAGIIAEGCQTSWVKAAEAGKGPPYERIQRTNFGDNRVRRYQSSYQAVQGRVREPEEEDDNDRKFIHEKAATRLHWAVGIIGNDEDYAPET